jgi:hypothetical protein
LISDQNTLFVLTLSAVVIITVSPPSFVTMPGITAPGMISEHRARIAGPAGLKGMFLNGRTTAIAIFAALGGLVYGCR